MRTIAPTMASYSLQRGLRAWDLIFEGHRSVLQHEQGILYVAYLVNHPPSEPVHGLDLAARARDWEKSYDATTYIINAINGRAAVVDNDSRLQECGLGFDDVGTLRALREKEKKLQILLEDEDQPEPVKAEVLGELEAIAGYRSQHGRGTEDAAQRAVRAVRRALHRFHERLAGAFDEEGDPHVVLRAFAAHIETYLLIPSARYSGRKCANARPALAGCFTYEPPVGVRWGGEV